MAIISWSGVARPFQTRSPPLAVLSPRTSPLCREVEVVVHHCNCIPLKMPGYYVANLDLERRGGSTLTSDPNNGSPVRVQFLDNMTIH